MGFWRQTDGSPVSGGRLLQVGLRSFFLQAAWNFERMQNIGWAWCMMPLLKRLYLDPARRTQAIKRHLEFFNTHPYLAGPILGYAIRVEEKVAAGQGASPAEVTALKMGMMGTLAALGDNFFWATLRPLAALLGVGFALFTGGAPSALGVALFLVAFNGPHLATRFLGLFQGYRKGPEIVAFLRRVNVQRLVLWMQLAGLVLLGALLAAFLEFARFDPGKPSRLGPLEYAAAGAALLFLLRRKVSAVRLFFVILAACAAAGLLRG
jgi:PTS system mannose-specific IID component